MKQTVKIFALLVALVTIISGVSFGAVRPLAGMKVMVDPGHGGWDPGAKGPTGLTEKSANLRVATALKNCLIEYGGANVKMTRYDDRYVSLSSRAWMANSWGAHRFISVHHNGSTNPAINGTSVYSYTYGSWASNHLRDKVQNRLLKMTGLRNLGANKGNFHVLRNTKMPAVLTEASFITNPIQEAKLKNPNYTWREGYYIYLGLVDHKKALR